MQLLTKTDHDRLVDSIVRSFHNTYLTLNMMLLKQIIVLGVLLPFIQTSTITAPDDPPPPSIPGAHCDCADNATPWSEDTCKTINMSDTSIDAASSCKYKVCFQKRVCMGVTELRINSVEVNGACSNATNASDIMQRLVFGGAVFRSDNPLGFMPPSGQ